MQHAISCLFPDPRPRAGRPPCTLCRHLQEAAMMRPPSRTATPWVSRRMLPLLTGMLLAALLQPARAGAQVIDTTQWVTNLPVDAIVSTPSTIYIGGQFTTVSPVTGAGAPVYIP